MKKWRAILILSISIIVGVLADIQPIDVEPVMKKEQPDFEDDTGMAGFGGDSNGKDNLDNMKNTDKAYNLLPKFSFGANLSFTHAFVSSLSVIIVSELGDKTFFIAAIMAMSHPRVTVFAGAMAALAIMHVMSAMFGFVITVIPRLYTFYASSALFAIFGIKMLRDGWKMTAEEGQEEFNEVQTDLRRRDDTSAMSLLKASNDEREDPVDLQERGAVDVEEPRKRTLRRLLLRVFSRIFIQSLTMTFLAEWGDRSQIATVILAAREDIYGVIVGGLLGHFLCTGLAVIGGRMIATKISVKTVTIIGGAVFLLFAISALIVGP